MTGDGSLSSDARSGDQARIGVIASQPRPGSGGERAGILPAISPKMSAASQQRPRNLAGDAVRPSVGVAGRISPPIGLAQIAQAPNATPLKAERLGQRSPRRPSQLPGVSRLLEQEGGKTLITLAETLTSTAEHNRSVGVHSAKDARSVFECVTVPPISIWSFINSVSQMVPVASVDHWLVTGCLIDRLCIYTNTPLTPWNIHRVILVSFTIAMQEDVRTNYLSTIARAGGVAVQDMHDMIVTFEGYKIPETVSSRMMKKVRQFLSKPVPLCKRLHEMQGGCVATLLGTSALSSSRSKLMAAKNFPSELTVVTEADADAGVSSPSSSARCSTTTSSGEGTSGNSSPSALISPTQGTTASGTPTSSRATLKQLSPSHPRTTAERAAVLLSSATAVSPSE
eukprot:TRINITY_DN27900_c0_g1_i1.p1 TRINITY_DN27900_c0_g1~~TRINITY_DN27900_c0_g1_i1.p1  ORF type:complete len:398 (+),score=126.27 TRINITY_DN27900_c0_g1_i1:417-1610(+)